MSSVIPPAGDARSSRPSREHITKSSRQQAPHSSPPMKPELKYDETGYSSFNFLFVQDSDSRIEVISGCARGRRDCFVYIVEFTHPARVAEEVPTIIAIRGRLND